ncbi:MAG: peptidoglycan DD-metalloendopeptidase family protein [Oscillospiraceae bacterium]|nr:peptidoglycan DD-metalloendopeptidase family protein [Oscillospiraceae bacterium]
MDIRIKRTLAMLFAVTTAAASFSAWQNVPAPAEAKTLEEIEKEKKEKQEQINKKKEQLAALADDLSKKAQYEQTLKEQIELINGKMLLIDTQLQNLHVDMEDTETQIAALEEQIDTQKKQVEKDRELFKKRIRAMYVHGNDGILSALVGATSFYDVLSRIDIVKRISKHDNEIIDRLRKEIRELQKSEQDLTSNLQSLNIQETEMGVLYGEFKSSQDELSAASAQNGTEMQIIMDRQADVKVQIAADQKTMDELAEEEEKIIAEAIAKAEAERKAKEEAERKAKEEKERKEREEKERKAKEEAEKKAKQEAERKAKEEAERKAKEEADRKAKEEAERKAAEEAAKKNQAVTQAPQQQTPTTVTTAAPAPAPVVTQAPVVTKAPATTPAPVVTQAPATQPTQTNPTPDYQGGKLSWPAPGYYRISSGFGPRWGTHHSGIDIIGSTSAINGAAACAAASGTVILVKGGCGHNFGKNYNCGCNGGYGNYVIISHGNGMYTLYAHLARATVSQGQSVTVGQQIGVIGSTGHSTGPHLHFEVRIGGNSTSNRVDPEAYLF